MGRSSVDMSGNGLPVADRPQIRRSVERLDGPRSLGTVLLAGAALYCGVEAVAALTLPSLGPAVLALLAQLEQIYPLWLLAAAATFATWSYRAHANLRLFGRSGIVHQDVATIGWWFVPVASLWMPFRVVFETVRGSEAPLGDPAWQRHPLPWQTVVWSITFVVGWVVSSVTPVVFVAAVSPSDVDAALHLTAAADLAMGVAAVLLIAVMRRTTRCQHTLVGSVGGTIVTPVPDWIAPQGNPWADGAYCIGCGQRFTGLGKYCAGCGRPRQVI